MRYDYGVAGRRVDIDSWPPLRGDYIVGDPESRVAVVTLASHLKVGGAAISGTCKTENLGVEKIVANIISNSNIRFLLVCGAESKGHLPGDALLALHKNGIDEHGRIRGSKGAIPFIQNLPPEAIIRFQDQISMIDRTGLEDVWAIEGLIEKYSHMTEPYDKEPFHVLRPRFRHIEPATGSPEEGDVILGCGVALDSSSWLLMEA